MAVIDTSVVRILPDFTHFRREYKPTLARETAGTDVRAKVGVDHASLKRATATIARAGATMAKSLAIGVAITGVAIGKGISETVSAASHLNETISRTGVLFGKNAGEIDKFAKGAADSIGQSRQQALDASNTFAIYGNAAKLSAKELVPFSTKLTSLASDMASAKDTSPAEAIEAIGSAMRGEMDPIEKYGVLLNESNLKATALKMGLIKTTKQALTPQQRVLAVNASLFEQLGAKGSKTLGDFANTSDQLANQQRKLQSKFENVKEEIGTGLLPVATRFVAALNEKVMPAVQKLWREHGPKIIDFLTKAGDKITDFATKLADGRIMEEFRKWRDDATPALQKFRDVAVPIFDKLKEVDYEKLAKTVGQFAILAAAFKGVSIVAKHPLITIFGLLAAKYPDETAKFLGDVADGIGKVIKWASDHPAATATIIGLLGAYQGIKGGGGVLTFALGGDGAKGLVGQIASVYESMEVRAHRANVERLLTIIAGEDAAGGAGGPGAAGRGGKMATALKVLGAVSIVATAVTLISQTGIGQAAANRVETLVTKGPGAAIEQGIQDKREQNARMRAGKEGIAEQATRLAGGNFGGYDENDLKVKSQAEAYKWLSESIKQHTLAVRKDDAQSADSNRYIAAYTEKRKADVAVQRARVTALQGNTVAEHYATLEAEKSRQTLADLLVQQGWSAGAADTYAQKIYGVRDAQKLQEASDASSRESLAKTFSQMGYNREEADKLAQHITDIPKTSATTITLPGSPEAKARLAELNTAINTLEGLKTTTLSMVDKNNVASRLTGLLAQQYVLSHPEVSMTEAENRMRKQQAIDKYAAGGKVRGFSPNPRADNIPAWLTADEFVQPRAAVKKYGVGFMEAIRTLRLPQMFADGGLAGMDQWPYNVDIAKTIVPTAMQMMGGATGAIGNLAGGMGWRWQESVLKAAFGNGVNFYSTTGGGHAPNSWHYKGRAVDLTPSMAIFNWIKSHYGARTLELIYGPAGVGIHHGQPHNFGGTLNSQHMNHVHWAFNRGGQVPRARLYDNGGVLAPGATLAVNNTGRNEYVSTDRPGGAVRLDGRDLAALAVLIAKAVATQTVTMDGRRVAEVTHSYDYLAGGL